MRESALHTAGKAPQKGFSLLELLVVMTVLAVLIAILLPAFQSVRARAEQVKCTLRLKQWSTAFNLYAAEHNGFYPPTWINSKVNYSTFVAPYLQPEWYHWIKWQEWRIDPSKASCPTYYRIQSEKMPTWVFHPYCYNSARMDYPWYWETFSGPDPESATHYNNLQFTANPMPPYVYNSGGSIVAPEPAVFPFVEAKYWHGQWGVSGIGISRIERRYIGQAGAADATGADTIGFYQARHKPQTVMYHLGESAVMFCGGVGAHWKFGLSPNVASWSQHNWWGSDGWNSRLPHSGGHEEVTAVHGKNVNILFMDGHVESLEASNPRIDYYMYNRIPAKGNPWPS
jgi:prepilin-type N-terminal cleavage/methylation domain-containing protein/prepilin-type processing-associated H-X9-DG protein